MPEIDKLTFGPEPQAWKTLSSSMALDSRWFPVRRDVVELPSGRVMDDYFVWESPDCACVVPVTKEGLFVICEQYRHAIKKITFQFPAGHINKGETPDQAALREAAEEVGCVGGTLTKLGKEMSLFAPKMSGQHSLFLLQGVELDPSLMENDDSELTRVHLKTRQEVEELLESGELSIASSIVAAYKAFRVLDASGAPGSLQM